MSNVIGHRSNVPFVFFGTSPVAVGVLESLKTEGYVPQMIVTTPDAPAGRKLALTPPPAKQWALANNIPLLQPAKLDAEFIYALRPTPYALFIVASYGKLIPKKLLDLPKYGTLNVHPSSLPKYRGPSPIQTAILNGDTETAVDIMLMTQGMDEGPILAEERVPLSGMKTNTDLEAKLSEIGGHLLARTIPRWLAGELTPREQDHNQATYTRKFEKTDGYIEPALLPPLASCHPVPDTGSRLNSKSDLGAQLPSTLGSSAPKSSTQTERTNSDKNYSLILPNKRMEEEVRTAERKVRAFNPTPGTYTILPTKSDRDIRIKILSAEIVDGRLRPLRIVPEGKREMSWDEFLRGFL